MVGFRACRADGVLALPKVGQASHLLLPTSLALTLRAAELWESRDTRSCFASICMPCVCAPAGESKCAAALREARAGSQIRRAVTPTVPGDVPSPEGSGCVRLVSLSKHRPSSCCRETLRRGCSHLCHRTRCTSLQSPLCRITSKPAEKSAPQRSFCSNRAALQFFCSARRWPPKRRP